LTITGIKEKKVPLLNDDFAREWGDFGSLEELKKKIKEELSQAKKEEARREQEEELINRLLEEVNIEVPASVIEKEKIALLRRWLSEQPQRSLSSEDYAQLQQQAKVEAEKTIKKQLLLSKIAQEEKIEVTDQELEEELKKIGEKNKLSSSQVRQILQNQGRLEEVKHSLLLRRTIDFLLDSVIIE